MIGVTCGGDAVGLDSHYATSRRHRRCSSNDLLDCGAVVGVHDSGQSDDSARARMLQAYGPDLRFCEHAAIALLLQDGSSIWHDNGCDKQPPAWSGVANSYGPLCAKVARMLEMV